MTTKQPKKSAASFWSRTVEQKPDAPAAAPHGPESTPDAPSPGTRTPLRKSTLVSAPSALAAIVLQDQDAKERLNHFDGAEPVRKLDAQRVRFSRFANRLESHFETPEYVELCATLEAAGGNAQPIGVRPVRDDPDHDFEVVFGHRRLRACQKLKLPVLSLIRDYTDAQLLEAMTVENLGRQNLSIYEWGRHFQAIIATSKAAGADSGLPQTQRQLAAAYGVAESTVSQALSAATLPEPVIACLATPQELTQRDIQALTKLRKHDETLLLERARALRPELPLPMHVALKRLLGLGRAPVIGRQTLVTSAGKGKMWQHDGTLHLQAPVPALDAQQMHAFGEMVQSWLEAEWKRVRSQPSAGGDADAR